MKRLKYIFTVLAALLVFVPSPVYAVTPGQISSKQAQWFCESFVALTGYAIPDYDSSKPNSQQYQVFMNFYGDCYRWCADNAVDFGNPVINHINFYGNGADYLAATVSANHTLIEHNIYGLFDVPDWVIKQLKKYAESQSIHIDSDETYNVTDFGQRNQVFQISSKFDYTTLFRYTNQYRTDMQSVFFNTIRLGLDEPDNTEYFFKYTDIGFICSYDYHLSEYDGIKSYFPSGTYVVKYNNSIIHFRYAVSNDNYIYIVSDEPLPLGTFQIYDFRTGSSRDKKTFNDYSDTFDMALYGDKTKQRFFFHKFADGYHLMFKSINTVRDYDVNTHETYQIRTVAYIDNGNVFEDAINKPSNIDDTDFYRDKYFKSAGDNQDINNYNNVVYNIDNSVTNNYQQVPDDSTSDILPWVKNIAQNLYNLSTNFNNWTVQLGRMLNLWFEGIYSRLEKIYSALLYDQVVPDVPVDADISNLKNAIDEFQKVAYKYFPFSVPWDMYTMISFFSAPPEAPKFDVPYINPDYTVGKYHIDLTPFDDAAKTARAGMRVVFDFGLLWLFKKFSDDTTIG